MKVITYNVKVKIETKEPRKELARSNGILIGRFTKDERNYKDQLLKVLQGKSNVIEVDRVKGKDKVKALVTENTIEIEGIKFRKMINLRRFIDELAEKYEAKCSPLNKGEKEITKQCESSSAKLYFTITSEKIKPIKKTEGEKKEESKKTEKKEETKQEDNKS